MGLYEKTRNVLTRELAQLLDPGSEVDVPRLRRLMLVLDEHRREVAHSLTRHEGELRHLLEGTGPHEATVALWRGRVQLARRHDRPGLEQAAQERLEQAERALADLRRRSELLGAAVANLTVSRDRLERALKLVRRRKREALEQLEEAARELLPAAPLAAPETRDDDELERAFHALELDEVGRHLDGPPGGAGGR